jgi:lysozyme
MDLITQLRRDEGVKLYPYRDSVGKLTIGVGRNLDDTGISGEEADVLLQNDIARATELLEKDLPWTAAIDPIRKAALVNMCFNMGIGGLLGFRQALGAMQVGDWPGAAKHMLDSVWAVQVGDRAKRLAAQIETGEWQ